VLGGVFVALGFLAFVPTARAEEKKKETCFVLCRPALKLEPTLAVGPLVGPQVQNVTTGEVRTLPPKAAFQLTLGLGIPTQWRHVRFTIESIFPVPGRPEIEAELNLFLLTEEMTRGWVELHFDVVDQLSPGMRPDVLDSYTHKLDLELDLAVFVFNWLPEGNWLRNIELEASLDYLATGLPRRGDVIDGQRYLKDARGWSVSFLLVMPLAPLVPQ
jgi:hypothetical protein